MKAKYKYIGVLQRSIVAVVAVCSIGISSGALSQAVLNPNQISGKVSFTNQNPDILNILSPDGFDQGFNYLYIRADSIGITPALNNYTYPTATSATQSDYQLTVESSATGISYKVSAEVRLGGRQDRYIIDSRESAKVYPEPAADVVHDIYQCASMLDIKFVNTAGEPVALNSGSATAHQELMMYNRPYYKLQAQSFSFPNGTTREFLAVNGTGTKYRLDVIMESGNDASSNLVRGLCRKEVTPRCDEVVPVTCVIGGAMDLGQIAGTVDVLGEDELDVSYLTRMRAFNGPLKNYRYDHVVGSGDYMMENMVPSDAETPAKAYMMYGELVFGTGFRTQFMRTPWLGISTYNPGVTVEGGKVTDLSNTFVLDPGYVSGLVLLAAPPAAEGESFLHDLNRDMIVDYSNDGVPDYFNSQSAHVEAWGVNLVAEGATMSASGGNAKAGFDGAYDAEISSFVGDYRMALGGLKGESSVWRPDTMALKFLDSNPVNLQDYRYSYLTARNNNIANQVIAPGSSKRIDHTYCMNDVALAYKSLSGAFYSPQATASGTFKGTDFLGNTVDQTLRLHYAYGTPRQKSLAANQGVVNLALPQGSYEVTPKVTAINPDGSLSYTELPPVSFDVACRQAVTLTTDLQLSTDELPLSTDQAETTVSGSINSLGNVVIIKYSHNQSPEVIVCENCGKNPTYSFPVTLTDGENNIVVSAEDEYGDVSTSSSFVTYKPILEPVPDPVKPLTIVGCSNKSLLVGAYDTNAKVDFTVTAEGGCGTPTVTCDAASGDFFSLGTTNVSCKAVDSCGTEQQCQFSIKVEAEAKPEPEPEPEPKPVCDDKADEAYSVSSVVSTNQLWPPNHKFSDVGLVVTEKDPCVKSTENAGSNTVSTVWSDEPELANDGSGNFSPDAKDLDTNINLRAERSGTGDGRVYLLISKGTSVSGDKAFSCTVVIVPHSMSKKSIAAVNAEAEEAKAYCEANDGSAPSSFYQHGVDEGSAKQEEAKSKNTNAANTRKTASKGLKTARSKAAKVSRVAKVFKGTPAETADMEALKEMQARLAEKASKAAKKALRKAQARAAEDAKALKEKQTRAAENLKALEEAQARATGNKKALEEAQAKAAEDTKALEEAQARAAANAKAMREAQIRAAAMASKANQAKQEVQVVKEELAMKKELSTTIRDGADVKVLENALSKVAAWISKTTEALNKELASVAKDSKEAKALEEELARVTTWASETTKALKEARDRVAAS